MFLEYPQKHSEQAISLDQFIENLKKFLKQKDERHHTLLSVGQQRQGPKDLCKEIITQKNISFEHSKFKIGNIPCNRADAIIRLKEGVMEYNNNIPIIDGQRAYPFQKEEDILDMFEAVCLDNKFEKLNELQEKYSIIKSISLMIYLVIFLSWLTLNQARLIKSFCNIG